MNNFPFDNINFLHKLFVKDRSGELLNHSASRGERPLVVPSLRNIQKAGKEEKV